MMLLSFHIIAIAALIAVTGNIFYQMGKKEGIRLTKNYYEQEQQTDEPNKSEISSKTNELPSQKVAT